MKFPAAIMDNLIQLCRQNDIERLGLFGSAARGEETDQSDIDLLVYFSKRKSLISVISLERKISAILGKNVDLLTEAAISPYLRKQILQNIKVIYEA